MIFTKASRDASRTSRRRARQGGATIVEFAIIAPVFLLLLIAVIELSMMYFASLTMQHAVREGTRYAVTGQNMANEQRYQTVLKKMRESSMGLYDQLAPVVSVNGSTATNADMFGAAGDIIVISVDCTWQFVTPMVAAFFKDGKAHFIVATTMRNESYNDLK